MWTQEEKIDISIIASDVVNWSINHYGYFVKSSNDMLEMVEEFSKDLARLPTGALSYVEVVKNNWIDNGNNRPPTIPEFLKHIRSEYNQANPPKLEIKQPDKFDYAGSWNAAESRGLKSAEEWMRTTYKKELVSPATKYVIREFFIKNGYDFKKVSQRMGMMR